VTTSQRFAHGGLTGRAAAARRLVAAVSLGLAVGWSIGDIGAVADRLSDAYGVRLGLIGLLTTSLFLVQTVTQVPAGRLIDRLGARTVGIGAVAVIAAGNAIALGGRSFGLALAARALMGLGTGSGFISGTDFARGDALRQGIYGGSSVGGAGLAIAIVPQLAGWRAPYWSSLVVCGLVLLALVAAPRPELVRHPARLAVLGDRRLYPLAVLHGCSFGLSIVAGAWITALLTRHGMGHRSAAVVGALVLLLGGVTRPLGGALGRRAWPAAWGSLAAGAVGCALLAAPVSAAVLGVGAVVVGLAAGLPFAPAIGTAQRLRPDAPAAAVGVVNGFANLTILVATPLIGLTFALPGDGRVGFAVLGALWAAGLVALRLVRTGPGARHRDVAEPADGSSLPDASRSQRQ
jgi:predicted MFS family arabinose efflux permease